MTNFDDIIHQVKKYQAQFPTQPLAFSITFEQISDLKMQYGDATRLKYYPAIDQDGNFVFYVFACDKDYNDFLPPLHSPLIAKYVIISRPCPSYCGENNVLNS